MKRKITYTLIATFVIIGLFSFSGTAFGERIDFSNLPEGMQKVIGGIISLNPAGSGEAPQYYDLLIKKTKTGVGTGAYKAGDIVAVRLTTSKWSPAERQNFWIVKMYLAPSQALALTKSKEKKVNGDEVREDEGDPDAKMIERRKYYIPPEILEKLQQGELVRNSVLREK